MCTVRSRVISAAFAAAVIGARSSLGPMVLGELGSQTFSYKPTEQQESLMTRGHKEGIPPGRFQKSLPRRRISASSRGGIGEGGPVC
jgi:hypothetical protein